MLMMFTLTDRWKSIINKAGQHDTQGSFINNSGELMTFWNASDMKVKPQVVSQPMEVDEDQPYL